MALACVVNVAFKVVLKRAKQHNTTVLVVTEKCQRIVNLFAQIPEANNVSKRFNAV